MCLRACPNVITAQWLTCVPATFFISNICKINFIPRTIFFHYFCFLKFFFLVPAFAVFHLLWLRLAFLTSCAETNLARTYKFAHVCKCMCVGEHLIKHNNKCNANIIEFHRPCVIASRHSGRSAGMFGLSSSIHLYSHTLPHIHTYAHNVISVHWISAHGLIQLRINSRS